MRNERTLIFLFPHPYIFSQELERLLKLGADINPPLRSFVETVRSLRRNCSSVYLVPGYFLEDGEMLPIAGPFLPRPTDRIIDIGVRIRKRDPVWYPAEPDFSPVVGLIKTPAVVIGGFHFADCLFRFFQLTEEFSIPAVVAPKATDFLFVHHGLAHLGQEVVAEIPVLANFQQYSDLLGHYLRITNNRQ